MSQIPLWLQSHNCFGISSPYYVSYDVVPYYIELHRHDFVEMQMTVAGGGREVINGMGHELKPGNLSILFPWHSHDLNPAPGQQLEIIKCCFDVELFLEPASPFADLRDLAFRHLEAAPFVCLEGEAADKMIGCFHELLEEFAAKRPWKEPAMRACLSRILIQFDRCRRSGDPAALAATQPVEAEKIAWEAVEYINLHHAEELDAAAVAGRFEITACRLQELLNAYIGLSFETILTETRIRNACAMLIYHKTAISHIAKTVGYPSEESFCRVFKNMKGVSPANYRKNHQPIAERMVYPLFIDAKIMYYIHKHYAENITMQETAKVFHYNENYLSDLLKAQTGQSFVELLHEIRIYHAADLLLSSDLPVGQVGFQVGFNSAETFQRVFKKLRGVSPGEYRKRRGETGVEKSVNR